MALARNTAAQNDLAFQLQECVDEFQELVEQYNATKTLLLRFDESERAAFIRRFVIAPLFSLLLAGAGITSLVFYLMAHFTTQESVKPTYERVSSILFWSLLGAFVLRLLLTTPSDAYSIRFRTWTRQIDADDRMHLNRMLHALERFHRHLTLAFGARNEEMQLLFHDLTRIHSELDNQEQPVKTAIETLNYTSNVLVHAQREIYRAKKDETIHAYYYNGRFFDPAHPLSLHDRGKDEPMETEETKPSASPV